MPTKIIVYFNKETHRINRMYTNEGQIRVILDSGRPWHPEYDREYDIK